MNLSDFTPQSLLFKVIAWVAVVTFVCGMLVAIANHFENVGYQRRVAEDEKTLVVELKAAAAKTLELQTKLNEAQNELAKAQADLLALTISNRNTVGQLRSQLDTYNRSLSSASREALSDRVAILSGIVEECSASIVEVARAGDASNDQVIMLESAWPANK